MNARNFAFFSIRYVDTHNRSVKEKKGGVSSLLGNAEFLFGSVVIFRSVV
jgi:hypothetical protein